MTKINYSKTDLQQGLAMQKQTQENPGSFGSESGVASFQPQGDLSKQYATRMAGESGAFATAMMQNPQFQQQLQEWNGLFTSSKMGNEFMASPPPNPHEMAAQQAMQQQPQEASQ